MSSRAPIRVGVVGVGRIGRMHAELIARRVDGLALAALADLNHEVAADVARNLGVEPAPVPELMARNDVDELALAAVEVFGLDASLLRSGPPDPNTLPPGLGPYDTTLDATATASALGVTLPSVHGLLEAFRDERRA